MILSLMLSQLTNPSFLNCEGTTAMTFSVCCFHQAVDVGLCLVHCNSLSMDPLAACSTDSRKFRTMELAMYSGKLGRWILSQHFCLHDLHWLSVRAGIEFKIPILCYCVVLCCSWPQSRLCCHTRSVRSVLSHKPDWRGSPVWPQSWGCPPSVSPYRRTLHTFRSGVWEIPTVNIYPDCSFLHLTLTSAFLVYVFVWTVNVICTFETDI